MLIVKYNLSHQIFHYIPITCWFYTTIFGLYPFEWLMPHSSPVRPDVRHAKLAAKGSSTLAATAKTVDAKVFSRSAAGNAADSVSKGAKTREVPSEGALGHFGVRPCMMVKSQLSMCI
jgi:hypothetical protein